MDGLVNIVGGCCGTTPGHIRSLSYLSQVNVHLRFHTLRQMFRCFLFSPHTEPFLKQSNTASQEFLLLTFTKTTCCSPVIPVTSRGVTVVQIHNSISLSMLRSQFGCQVGGQPLGPAWRQQGGIYFVPFHFRLLKHIAVQCLIGVLHWELLSAEIHCPTNQSSPGKQHSGAAALLME